MRNDISEQPRLLASALQTHMSPGSPLEEAVRAIARARPRRIVLSGMGSSLFACYPAFLRLFDAGFAVTWIELAELLHWGASKLDRDALLVLVSQSGETIELLRLLADHRPGGLILAVTNTPDSTLARQATYVVPIGAGLEQAIATKTYTTSLLALWLLAERILGAAAPDLTAALSPTLAAVERFCATGPALVAGLSDIWFGTGPVTLLGRGPSLATALAGGLLLKETAKIHAEGMSNAQFRHGPVEIAGSQHRAIVCAGSEQTRYLDMGFAADLAAYGSQVLLLGQVDRGGTTMRDMIELPPLTLAPLAEIIPLQFLAREIALRHGIVPGAFHRAAKVTTVE
jgi:glutamine---fructose-6-phosphate transaminase (isomerizing)